MAKGSHKKHHSYRASPEAAIRVKRLLVMYGDHKVVNNVSFDIARGKITAIIGPNGSGKTTLIKSMLGLVPKKRGTVLFFDRELDELRSRIGYVPQRFQFDTEFPITVEEFLELGRNPEIPKGRIGEKIEEVGLPKKIAEQSLGQLSGGQVQRILIARAILNDPDLLILDEPYAGIDIVGESTFFGILNHLNKEHGTTVVMVSHEIDIVAKVVDRVLCFNNKVVCHGPTKKMLSMNTIKRLYGKEAVYYGDLLGKPPCPESKRK